MSNPRDIIDALHRPKPPGGMTRQEWDAVMFSLLRAVRADDFATMKHHFELVSEKLGLAGDAFFWSSLSKVMYGNDEQVPDLRDPDMTREEFNRIVRTVSDLLLLEFVFDGRSYGSETSDG